MENEFIISDAIPDDVPEMLSVRRITWLATYPNRHYGISANDLKDNLDKINADSLIRWQKRIAEDTSSHTWFAKFQSRIIGFVSASKDKDCNHIRALYILPDYQGKGIGKQLMQTALGWLGNNLKISLDVVTYNEKAINFYRKFGFVENGPTQTCEAGNLANGKHLPEIGMIKDPTNN
jgi:ribosomal protein S18 acetylase RimI-like enzyme